MKIRNKYKSYRIILRENRKYLVLAQDDHVPQNSVVALDDENIIETFETQSVEAPGYLRAADLIILKKPVSSDYLNESLVSWARIALARFQTLVAQLGIVYS